MISFPTKQVDVPINRLCSNSTIWTVIDFRFSMRSQLILALGSLLHFTRNSVLSLLRLPTHGPLSTRISFIFSSSILHRGRRLCHLVAPSVLLIEMVCFQVTYMDNRVDLHPWRQLNFVWGPFDLLIDFDWSFIFSQSFILAASNLKLFWFQLDKHLVPTFLWFSFLINPFFHLF